MNSLLCKAKLSFVCFFLVFFANAVNAEIIDPENYILKSGYQSKSIGDDGKTVFYIFTERALLGRIAAVEVDIDKLPKRQEVFKVCDFMRGGVKAKLIEEQGIAYDVALANYGYSGKIIACSLKYMLGSKSGTQLIFSKSTEAGVYIVYVAT